MTANRLSEQFTGDRQVKAMDVYNERITAGDTPANATLIARQYNSTFSP